MASIMGQVKKDEAKLTRGVISQVSGKVGNVVFQKNGRIRIAKK